MTAKPRYDFYQTETAVNLSVFVKGLSEADVDVVFGQHSISMKLRPASPASPQSLELQLFDDIDAADSSYKILSTKVDVLLRKQNPGRRWESLESKDGSDVPSYSAASAASSSDPPTAAAAPAPAPKRRSKWDKLALDDDDEGAGKGKGSEASIDAFFQGLYADADDDTKRAMMKSYIESGGTSLSTNWSEVGKGEVTPQPPTGTEARKWS